MHITVYMIIDSYARERACANYAIRAGMQSHII